MRTRADLVNIGVFVFHLRVLVALLCDRLIRLEMPQSLARCCYVIDTRIHRGTQSEATE